MDGKFIPEYINKMKTIHKKFLELVENNDTDESILKSFIKLLDDQQIRTNKNEIKTILHLISKVSDNHYRTSNFITNIEKLLKNLKKEITQTFTNLEIFNIFKTNKRILLFLFNEKILIPDKSIAKIITSSKYEDKYYPHYFLPEFESLFDEHIHQKIKSTFSETMKEDPELFKIKRKNGVNANYLSLVIQNDSMNEFTSHIKKTQLPLTSKIEKSIFETHLFLLNNHPTLIEYAAFFGSIDIVKYLFMNGVELKPSLWLYAVHSHNQQLINFIEENQVEPPNNDYNEIYIESIKSHNKLLISFIKSNYIPNDDLKKVYFLSKCIEYYNFTEFHKNKYEEIESLESCIFYYFCKYDYLYGVNTLLKNSSININSRIILKCLI